MSEQDQGDEIAGLVALGSSEDYRDRMEAVVKLAKFAHVAAAHRHLEQLVLDPKDTSVTEAAAQALVARGDQAGLRVLSAALERADENHADWIEAGIADALGESGSARAWAIAAATRLVTDLTEPISDPTRLLTLLAQAGRV